MNIYVAGASKEIDDIESYMTRLREAGHTITHDWCACIREAGDANPRDASLEDMRRWAEEDLDGLERADVLWLIVPRNHSSGAWIELGSALRVDGKLIVVSGDWRRSIFCALADERFDTHEDALASLVSREAA